MGGAKTTTLHRICVLNPVPIFVGLKILPMGCRWAAPWQAKKRFVGGSTGQGGRHVGFFLSGGPRGCLQSRPNIVMWRSDKKKAPTEMGTIWLRWSKTWRGKVLDRGPGNLWSPDLQCCTGGQTGEVQGTRHPAIFILPDNGALWHERSDARLPLHLWYTPCQGW